MLYALGLFWCQFAVIQSLHLLAFYAIYRFDLGLKSFLSSVGFDQAVRICGLEYSLVALIFLAAQSIILNVLLVYVLVQDLHVL